MTEEESKAWFEKMRDFSPKVDNLAHNRGSDGTCYGTTSCTHWEDMYQAFKARLLKETNLREWPTIKAE